MTLDIGVFSVEKAGSTATENEDRAAWSLSASAATVAIADGATESSYSDIWAEALVGTWIGESSQQINSSFLRAARAAWNERLPDIAGLPWYAQAKLEQGSHATFAGLHLRIQARRLRWRAEIVGDCEIFVFKIRKSLHLARCEPAKAAAEFGYHPDLLGTSPSTPRVVPMVATGRLREPFEIWLTTDAFAAACLGAVAEGRNPWNDWAAAMDEPNMFRNVVDSWRTSGALRNDDTTVCRVRAGR
jgi:hypothetical protein